MIFGLSITESVETNIGSVAGTMIRRKEVCSCGYDPNGDQKIQVVIEFYESRAKYLAKEAPLQVRLEAKRLDIIVEYGKEITDTLIHQYIQTPLAERFTIAEET